jgi:hypothetical protein
MPIFFVFEEGREVFEQVVYMENVEGKKQIKKCWRKGQH